MPLQLGWNQWSRTISYVARTSFGTWWKEKRHAFIDCAMPRQALASVAWNAAYAICSACSAEALNADWSAEARRYDRKDIVMPLAWHEKEVMFNVTSWLLSGTSMSTEPTLACGGRVVLKEGSSDGRIYSEIMRGCKVHWLLHSKQKHSLVIWYGVVWWWWYGGTHHLLFYKINFETKFPSEELMYAPFQYIQPHLFKKYSSWGRFAATFLEWAKGT